MYTDIHDMFQCVVLLTFISTIYFGKNDAFIYSSSLPKRMIVLLSAFYVNFLLCIFYEGFFLQWISFLYFEIDFEKLNAS